MIQAVAAIDQSGNRTAGLITKLLAIGIISQTIEYVPGQYPVTGLEPQAFDCPLLQFQGIAGRFRPGINFFRLDLHGFGM